MGITRIAESLRGGMEYDCIGAIRECMEFVEAEGGGLWEIAKGLERGGA